MSVERHEHPESPKPQKDSLSGWRTSLGFLNHDQCDLLLLERTERSQELVWRSLINKDYLHLLALLDRLDELLLGQGWSRHRGGVRGGGVIPDIYPSPKLSISRSF